MKKYTKILVPAVAIAIGFSSCDKTPTVTTPTTTTPTTTTPTAPAPVTPTVGNNFWGALVALQMKFSYTLPQLPTPVAITSELGAASFYDAAGSATLVDAGTVALNSNDLAKQTNKSYSVTATAGMTPATLNLDNSVKWTVAGGASTPAISYTHSGAFPGYTGTLATEIDKSKDFEVTLGTQISGADSVYVVIVTSAKTIIKAVKGNPAPAKATITAAELSALPTISDNSAYLEVVPFTYATQSFSGKQFVFIKEAAVLGTVNIK